MTVEYIDKLPDSAIELVEYNWFEFALGKYYFDYNTHRIIMRTRDNRFKLVNVKSGKITLRDIDGIGRTWSLKNFVREMLKRIGEKDE